MAIHPDGLFDLRVRLTRSGATWFGQGRQTDSSSRSAGLVGARPRITLAGGVVALQSTQSGLGPGPAEGIGLPLNRFAFRVGKALETVVEEGDELRIWREATGDMAASLVRDDGPVLAIGAVDVRELAPHLRLELDPRVEDQEFYSLTRWLEAPGSELMWLHASDPRVEASLGAISSFRGERLVIAIGGPDRRTRALLNNRAAVVRSAAASVWYLDVHERFTSCEQFLTYVRQLPATHPDDLHVRFTMGDQTVQITEGAHAFVPPWHLYVENVYRLGMPGTLTRIGVARQHPGLSGDMLVDSVKTIAGLLPDPMP